MLDKFVHSINIGGTLYLISRNVDFRTFILQLSYYKNNFQPQKFSLDICQYTNLLVQITLSMVFIKHNSLKSDIFFNSKFMPCFSGPMFFTVQVFQGPGFSESRFFWVQVFQGLGFSGFGSRVRVQGPGPGSGSRVQKQPSFCPVF